MMGARDFVYTDHWRNMVRDHRKLNERVEALGRLVIVLQRKIDGFEKSIKVKERE